MGESDRGPTEYEPGLLLTYTDEAHGYGNVGTDNPPAQSPLDSVPEPEEDAPNLNDATFQATEERSTFSDASAEPHLDNYTEPARGENKEAGGDQPWTFDYDCLGFTVESMSGNTEDAADKFDLVGDVDFAMGNRCALFNYGYAPGNVLPPAAPIAPACPEGSVPDSGHTDANAPNVHALAVDCVVWWEIARGVTPDLFRVENPVTRGQMASFIAQLIEKSGGQLPAGSDAFGDDNNDIHQANINKLAAAGIVKGTEPGKFAPEVGVGRDQMATFLVNGYQYLSDNDLTASFDYFGDDGESVHQDNINKAAEAGFASGRGGGYDPYSTVRRDQMASFVIRVLATFVEEGTTEPKLAA
jgi:hypothetical protein